MSSKKVVLNRIPIEGIWGEEGREGNGLNVQLHIRRILIH